MGVLIMITRAHFDLAYRSVRALKLRCWQDALSSLKRTLALLIEPTVAPRSLEALEQHFDAHAARQEVLHEIRSFLHHLEEQLGNNDGWQSTGDHSEVRPKVLLVDVVEQLTCVSGLLPDTAGQAEATAAS